MSPANKRCPWCGESHPTEMIQMGEIEVTTCPRLGAHEAVMLQREMPAGFDALAKPIAQVRLEDGSQVVALEPKDLEVKAFGVEDLDMRGLPRWRP